MSQPKEEQQAERYHREILGAPLWLIWDGSVRHLAWQILGLDSNFNLEYMLSLDSGCACMCVCVHACRSRMPRPSLPHCHHLLFIYMRHHMLSALRGYLPARHMQDR